MDHSIQDDLKNSTAEARVALDVNKTMLAQKSKLQNCSGNSDVCNVVGGWIRGGGGLMVCSI